MAEEVRRHLPVVDDKRRPTGEFLNKDLHRLKDASKTMGYFLMVDVIFFKTPLVAHMVYILATSEDGSVKTILFTKVKYKQFDSQQVLDALLHALKVIRAEGLEHHLLTIVADEGTNNTLLGEAGYPVVVDLRHLINRMNIGMAYTDVVLQAVHKHALFRPATVEVKWAQIRAMAKKLPAKPKRRIEAEIFVRVLEQVVARRFAIHDSPFHLRECNSDTLESSGRKIGGLVASIMTEALKKDPRMRGRLLE